MKTAALIYIAVILVALWGWVANLIAVVHAVLVNEPFTSLLVVRIVGIPVAALGAILGFF